MKNDGIYHRVANYSLCMGFRNIDDARGISRAARQPIVGRPVLTWAYRHVTSVLFRCANQWSEDSQNGTC